MIDKAPSWPDQGDCSSFLSGELFNDIWNKFREKY